MAEKTAHERAEAALKRANFHCSVNGWRLDVLGRGELRNAIKDEIEAAVADERAKERARWLANVSEVDTRRRGGVPVLPDTRVTISQVLAELAEGCGPEELARNLTLDIDAIRALLYRLSAASNFVAEAIKRGEDKP